MRKFLLCCLISFMSICPVFADEWDNFSEFDRSIDAQKPITNDEFEKAIETLQAPMKKKQEKQRKKKIKKLSGGGTSLHNSLDPNTEITSQSPISEKPKDTVLNIPVEIILDNGEKLEKGFYKVIAQKEKDNNLYFYFYQSQYYKGKTKARVTENDFDEETIDFIKIDFPNENYARIMYGSLETNAYAYVKFEL